MGPGREVERDWIGRDRVRTETERRTPRPGQAVGDVIVPMGKGESGLVRLQSRPPPV